ncbi:hypothetical protein COO60DRAFT_1642741 [Scenedesmus sp. NREL 46B-D3]|nr:hypothetical protein COO60DRAFT_1642741 [Scenedesmus sp. NREL 46B-D3]
MADLDEEFARFAAELKSVEQAVAADTAAADDAAAAPPPLAPPPILPPPVAQQRLTVVAMVGPHLQQQEAWAAISSSSNSSRTWASSNMGDRQVSHETAVEVRHAAQRSVRRPAGRLPAARRLDRAGPPGDANARRHGGHAGDGPGRRSGRHGRALAASPLQQQQQQAAAAGSAPADAETLRKLKEELVQQKQADGKGGKAGGGGAGASKKALLREAAGLRWVDPTLSEWPENDFRIFVGDLGNEVNDDALGKAFQRYPSFAKAKIIRDKRTNKSKGYGIVSLLDGNDFAKALKEMNGKYIGNRPCKLSRSTWQERAIKGGGGGAGGKRKEGPGGGAQRGGGVAKAQRTGPHGPKAKYHVPILRQ